MHIEPGNDKILAWFYHRTYNCADLKQSTFWPSTDVKLISNDQVLAVQVCSLYVYNMDNPSYWNMDNASYWSQPGLRVTIQGSSLAASDDVALLGQHEPGLEEYACVLGQVRLG